MYPNLSDVNLSHPFFSQPILGYKSNMSFPAYPSNYGVGRYNNLISTDTFHRMNTVKPKSCLKSLLIGAGILLAGFLGFKGGSKVAAKFIK